MGCVFVNDGRVIASGRNAVNATKNATRHAEIECIEQIIKTESHCKLCRSDGQLRLSWQKYNDKIKIHSLRQGPSGPSSLALAPHEDWGECILEAAGIQKDFVHIWKDLYEFRRISAPGNALMLLETILWELWRICATGNALKLLETILCEFGQICSTGICSSLAGINFMRVWTNLCYRECFTVTKCW